MTGKRTSLGQAGAEKKRPRKQISMKDKMEILRRLESGEKTASIVKSLGLSESTIRTIRSNADKIKASIEAGSSSASYTVTRARSILMEKMENLLRYWIEDQNHRHVPLSMAVIQMKAMSIFNDLKAKGELECTDRDKTFSASCGWFFKFKGRHSLHNIKFTGESASADHAAASTYPADLKKIIEEGQYSPQQIFNADETGLYWKKMPSTTYIATEEKVAPGLKAAKDRLTLLLGSNASGDFKLKPLLIYHSENPRAMKGFSKQHLPVIWRSNKKAWVTKAVFQEWFSSYFCPAVKEYCSKKNISNKAILILDNAGGHAVNFEELSDNVQVVFMPPNTTSLLQPMDQGVISTFKAYYLRRTLKHMLSETDVAEGENVDRPTVREFWKNYNIMKGIKNISESWDEVTSSTLNGCWKKVWPECVRDKDFEGFDSVGSNIQRDIVSIAHEIGFEDVEEEDVIDLLDSHREPLSNEELIQLQEEREMHEDPETPTTPTSKSLSIKGLEKSFEDIENALKYYEENDVDRERSQRVGRKINDAVECYRELYRQKKKKASQPSIDKFFRPTTPSSTSNVAQQSSSITPSTPTDDRCIIFRTPKTPATSSATPGTSKQRIPVFQLPADDESSNDSIPLD